MNQHDLKRQQDLIKALNKAKEKARLARLYLSVNADNWEETANVTLAAEHIEIALGHLGIEMNIE
ncbi:MAG: hypothetical protein JWM44_1177 [Bacilli bacterium]|nr:hypothetical protein [Bacilli bacterium]